MNNPENFLTRWSRRKFAAAAETEETKSSAASSRATPQDVVGSERTAGAERSDGGSQISAGIASNTAEPPFDPLSVPPIESITADTDIRGFLAPGVPPELTRAALRRSWATDPKIRDFVGLADYDWDFNAPGSMAGFGPLEMTDDLRRAAVQIIGRISTQDQTAGMLDPASVNTTSDQNPGEPDLTPQAQPAGHAVNNMELAKNAPNAASMPPSCEVNDARHRYQESDSAFRQPRKPENLQLIVHQSHGGARPK
jgi:hypothetical protein